MPKQKTVSQLRFLFGHTDGFRLKLFWALTATVLSTLFSFLMPQVIRMTIDSIIGDRPYALPAALRDLLNSLIAREQLRENLWIPALAAALFALLSALTNFQRRYTSGVFAEGTVKNLRDRLFERTQRLPYAWHIQIQTGDIIQRCTSDIETVRAFLSQQLIELFRVAIMFGMATAMMLSIHVKLALVALAFLPLIAGYSIFFYAKAGVRFMEAEQAEGQVMTAVQENLTGMRVVRAFGREAYELEKFNRLSQHYTGLWLKLGRLLGLYWGIGDLVTGLQTILVLVFGVVAVVGGDGLYLGGLVALMTYNSYLIWPIRGLGRILSEMSRSSAAIARIREVLEQRPEQDAPDAVAFPFKGELEFDRVSFGYGETPILREVSFRVPAGGTLAILGGTGSGKSTLAHLIARLYPLKEGQGSIRIDGVDVNDIEAGALRSQVGLVLQEPFLFSRSIRRNIQAARTDLNDEQVRAYAAVAAVDEAVAAFDKGYDTVVGERGVTLSGGQKQRVAIARMLAQQPKIMIFDDSLSAVDTETDLKIRRALRAHAGDVTTLLISHRASTLMEADHIIVLEAGRIVEQGTHASLMARGGIYRRVCELQTGVDIGPEDEEVGG
ncbi:MAG: ABC transporter ATP-binding protein [Clostridiales bacterium]|nr:ABC transporter ATP-binding protein [Clostridiales bacterium]